MTVEPAIEPRSGSDELAAREFFRIACIVESKGRGTELGVAILNVPEMHCIMSQFSDTPTNGHLGRLLSMHEPDLVR